MVIYQVNCRTSLPRVGVRLHDGLLLGNAGRDTLYGPFGEIQICINIVIISWCLPCGEWVASDSRARSCEANFWLILCELKVHLLGLGHRIRVVLLVLLLLMLNLFNLFLHLIRVVGGYGSLSAQHMGMGHFCAVVRCLHGQTNI